jgi:hypothetical protein
MSSCKLSETLAAPGLIQVSHTSWFPPRDLPGARVRIDRTNARPTCWNVAQHPYLVNYYS